MGKKVLVISFSFEQEPDAFHALEEAGLEPVLWASADRKDATEEDLCAYWQAMKEKPVAIVMGADIPITGRFLSQAESLKVISLNCAGYDHVDLAACEKYGVKLVNVPRRNFDAVADLAWGLILSYMRNIPKGNAAIRAGKWAEGVERSMAVSGKTLGIVGMGAIGQAVAQRAMGFHMELVARSGSRKPEIAAKYNLRFLDDETFFRTADIIVLCCPNTPETYHMINEKTLAMMKPSAVLINPSRGGLVDTDALYRALKNNEIAGAALDAYEEEPLLESPLFELENILLTPHIGGLADKQIHDVAVQSAVNCGQVLVGNTEKLNLICG